MSEVKGREKTVDKITVTVSTVDGKTRTLVYNKITNANIAEYFQDTDRDFPPQNRCLIDFSFYSMRVEEE